MNQIDSAIVFLEQRANEDEQWALSASAPYPYVAVHVDIASLPVWVRADGYGDVVRHTPRRTMQDVKAVREVIAQYRQAHALLSVTNQSPLSLTTVDAGAAMRAWSKAVLILACNAGWQEPS